MSSDRATKRPTHEKNRVALGVAYGLIAGGAVGSLLLALTGDVVWLSITPGIGLLVGLAVASIGQRREPPRRERA